MKPHEWMYVFFTGALAGLGASLIALWVRYERNELVNNPRLSTKRYWFISMGANATCGGFASLYLWSQFTAANWSSTNFATGEFGAALFVGAGGASALQRYLYVSDSLGAAINEETKSTENLIPASPPFPVAMQALPAPVDPVSMQAHTGAGGQQT